jgi:hypothetical protein
VADKDSTLESIGHELKVNPPAVVKSTQRKFGAERARSQNVAIMLNKARRAGVKIPSYSPKSMSNKGA